jgi:hypothetical protein
VSCDRDFPVSQLRTCTPRRMESGQWIRVQRHRDKRYTNETRGSRIFAAVDRNPAVSAIPGIDPLSVPAQWSPPNGAADCVPPAILFDGHVLLRCAHGMPAPSGGQRKSDGVSENTSMVTEREIPLPSGTATDGAIRQVRCRRMSHRVSTGTAARPPAPGLNGVRSRARPLAARQPARVIRPR